MTKEQLLKLSHDCLLTDNRPDWLVETIKRPEQSLYYLFLMMLAETVKPRLIVELGTNRGTGAAHFKLGYPDARVITVDKKQPEHIKEFLTSHGIEFIKADTITAAKLIPNNIDILFIDALHTYEKATEELKTYLPKMNKGGIIIFDDIHLDEGMQQFWDEIEEEKIDISHLHPSPGFGALIV